MTTSSTIPCKRIATFLCTLVIALALFTSPVNAQVTSTLQQAIGVSNVVQGTSQNQLTPMEVMVGCNCNTFSICTSQVNDKCYGENNGSATVTASGGSTPYTYSWNTNPKQTTQTATGLSAGTYTVTVTDNMGCTATACVTITQGSQISITIPTPSAICKGSSTTLTANGTSCVSYTWSPSTGLNVTTGSSVTANPTITTTYTVTGTNSSGCTGTATVVVTVNSGLTLTVPTPSAICKGGGATLTVSGATCIGYTWSPSTGLSATTGSSVTASPTITTTYTVTGTNSSGCVGITTVVVTVNPNTTISISTPSAICKGGSTTLTVNGTTCTSYKWSPSTGLSATTGSSVTANPTITTTYTVTGTNSSGCTGTTTVVVTVNPSTTITVNTPSGICKGSCATLTVSGSPCTTYTWSPSTGLTVTTGSSISACPTLTTTYTVTGSDHNGCPATGTVVVTVNPTTTITVNTPSGICKGSCATLTVSGSPCTTYTWSPSTGLTVTTGSSISACPTLTTTYTVTGSDNNGCPATGHVVVTVNPTTTITVNTPSGICKGSCATLTVNGAPCVSYTWSPSTGLTVTTGSSISACPTLTTTYTVTGSDNNGCPATGTVVVTVNPTTTITVNTPSGICKGSCATLTVSGSPCTTYTWSPSTGLTVTTGSSISACPTLTTTYTVTGSDNNGCPATGHVVVTVNPTTTITVNTPSGICKGSCATLTVNGAPCVSYTWSPSTGLTVTTGSSISACPTLTTTYTVTGSDNNGCPATGTVVVTVNPTTTITVNTPSGICKGSCATLTVNGTPCVSYTWTPSTGLTVTTGSSILACPTLTTTYTVTGSDNNGCPATGTVVVTVNPTTTITVNTPSAICKGSCATLTVNGTPCVSYTWTPSTGLTVTTGSSISACPTTTTTYTVTGSDHNGCPATGTVVVTVNPTTTITVPTPSAICKGSCATLTATGATSYNWSPSTGLTVTTGSSISACPTLTTTYTVTGSDINGCPATGNVVVTVNPTTTITVPTPSAICKGSCATLTATGATSYSWSPSTGLTVTTGSSISACPTLTTTYTVTGSDINGCPATGNVVVTVNPTTTITVPTPSAICKGSCATLTATGATSYSWSPSTGLTVTTGSSISACPTLTTTYTVTGSDINGCPATGNVVVTVNPTTTITVNTPSPICDGTCTTLTVNGTPCTTYSWSPSTGLTVTTGSSISACPTLTTTYTVTGSDHNGCPATGNVVVTVMPLPTVTLTVNDPTICKGGSDTLKASGLAQGGIYTWSPSTGLSATTGSSVIANPTITTTYTVNGTNPNGCMDPKTVVVYVNHLQISVPPASACINDCANLTATGATYYTWSPATALSATTGSSITACPKATTTYTVIGTNGSGCIDTVTTVVTIYPLPVITLTARTHSICSGSSDTITASGASVYTWSPSAGLNVTIGSQVIASPTVTTTYTVIGTNSNECVCNDTIVIKVNNKPVITLQPKSNTMCAVNGECDGHTFKILATGTNVTYQWYLNGKLIPGATDTLYTFSPGTPADTGKYFVIVSNQCGSDTSDTAAFILVNSPVIYVPSTSICYGSCTTLTATGTNAISYSWSPSTGLSATTGSSVTACPTMTTTYTITATGLHGCTDDTTAVITVNPKPTIHVASDTICYGNCATLQATGLNESGNYTWSPSNGLGSTTGTTVSACPTATTTYTIIGTNGFGCSDTTTAVVLVNPKPVVRATSDTICYGKTGVLTASGASTYAWSPAGGLSSTTGSSVAVTVGATTTYTVIGTNTYGCTDTTTAVLKVNPKPVVRATSDTVCYGKTGVLTASGASTYAWSPAGGLSSTTGSSVAVTVGATTTYTVIGTNTYGCTDTTTAVLKVNPKPVVIATSDTVCYGKTGVLTASGASTYAWSPASGLSSTTGSSVAVTVGATTTYTVIGTNAYGCTDTTTAVLKVNPKPEVTATSDTVCYGKTGVLTASGASTYAWSPAGGLSSTAGSSVTVTVSATTTYTVIGTNTYGCTDTTRAVSKVNPKPIVTATSDTVCYGKTGVLTASGASTYVWSPAGGLSATTGSSVTVTVSVTTTYTVIGTNTYGCTDTTRAVSKVNPKPIVTATSDTVCYGKTGVLTASGASTYVWSPAGGLSATTGSSVTVTVTLTTTYTVIGTNTYGCTDTTTAVLKVNMKPTIRVASDTICYGNCATLQASGLGESGSYTWSPSNGLGSTTGTTVSACPTATTTYTIIGVNGVGCSDTTTAVVLVNPKPVIHVASDTICYGTCATLQATGLNESGSYTWSPSNGLGSTTGTTVSACPTATTTYTIIGVNGYGCSDTTTAVVLVNPKPVITATSDTVCYGKTGVLTASGASTYLWSPAGGLSAITGSSVTVTVSATTTYTVIGTNAYGCSDTTTAVLRVNPKPIVTATSDTVCYGKTGVLTASGASTYSWSPAGGLNATTGSSVTVTVGETTTYTVIGTNTNGCTDTTTAVLRVNPKPIVTATSDTVCYGKTGVLTASGASTYTWSPASGLSATTGSSVTVTVSATTTYTVIGINTNGCTDTTTAVLKVNMKPTIRVASDTICYGNCATLQASGLNESGSYTWSPSIGLGSTTGTTVSACPTITTTYTIIGINGFGCSDTTTAVVLVNPKPVINVASDTICYGTCGTLQATGLNESGSYTWSPSNGLGSTTGTTVSACPTITTTYTIIGVNGYGCSDTTTAVVLVNPKPVITATSDTVCHGKIGVLTASGASTYVWSPAGGLSSTTGSSVTVNVTLTTTYTVIGTNTSGCTDTTTSVLRVNPKPVVTATSDTVCYGKTGVLTASGASTYIWSPAGGLSATTGSSVTVTVGETTTYTVIGTNANGCTDTTTSVLRVNPKPIVTATSDTVCYGKTGVLTASGASTYTWSPASGLSATTGSSVTVTVTLTTTYTVIGTNTYGCTDTTTAVLKVNMKPTIRVASDTICYGNCATLQASGLNESGSYTWSPSNGLGSTTGTTVSACPTITTTYTIIGINGFGCSDTTTAVVLVNPKPVIRVASDTICYGTCGTLQATGLNESGSYTWSPSNGLGSTTGTTVSACPTITTTYTIIGINGFGCSDTTTAVVLVNPKPVITATSDTVCLGNAGVLTASGASTYTWSPAKGLSATTGSSVTVNVRVTTTYTVIGTNAYGCTDTTTAVLRVNPKPIVTATSDTVCYGKIGVLTASGASTYSWSPAGGLSATTGSSVTVTVGETTTYTVIGTNTYGCTDTTTAVLKVNSKPIITATSDTVCYGKTGVLTASGASTYSWSPAGGLSSTTGSSVTVTVGATTTYTVIGTNTYGCTDTTTAVILVNPKPIITATSDTVCYGKTGVLTASGASTYIWSPAGGLSATTGSSVTVTVGETTTYTVIGTNAYGCTDTTTAVLKVNPKPIVTATSDTVCYGKTGVLTASGASTYTWSPAGGLSATTGSSVTVNVTLTTTYTVIGTNTSGCTDTTTSVLRVNPKPVVTATSDTVCYGKTGVLTASGASTYVWSPAGGLSATTGSSVTVTVGETTTYTVIGTNANGCTDTTTSVLRVNPKPIITATSDTVCYGKTGVLTASGASTYIWSPAGGLSATTGSSVTVTVGETTTYTVIGTNANGCTDTTTSVLRVNPKPIITATSDTVCYGKTGVLTASGASTYTWSPASGLSATTGSSVTVTVSATTTYTVIGTNTNGCTDTTTAVLKVNMKPTIRVASDTICYGNCATLQASGLNESGSYTWSPSIGLGSTTGTTVSACPTITTTYTIIGINGFGCSDTTTAVVLVNPKPVINVASDTICYGTCGTLQATGLNESGSYTWSPSNGLGSTTGTTVSACPTITTTYTIIGINGFGCSDTTTAVVLVNPKPVITATSDTVCLGNAGVLTASGASTYTWSPAKGLSATTGSSVTVNVRVTTTYTVIGTNAYGCVDTTTSVLKVNPKPTINVPSDTICYGTCATLQASGLNESGSYIWSPSIGLGSTTGTTVSACPTATTTYTIIGINGFGCSDTTTAVVLVNPKPIIVAASDTVCYGKTGVLTASGASTYTWSPAGGLSSTAGSSVIVTVSATTTYTVIGTNVYGCSDTTTAVVLVNPKPVIAATSDTVCYGKTGVLTASGASTYTWSPAGGLSATTGSSVTVTVSITTTYTVIGTNTYGCTDTTASVLLVNPKPVVTATSDTVCYGNSGVLTASGASTYAWSPAGGLSSTAGSSVTVTVSATTTYTVIGTNAYGCTDTTTAVLKVNPKPTITVASDTICYGTCATLQASGLNESGSYIWSPSNGLGSTTGTTVSACPTATTTYTIIGTNGFGCSDTTTAVVTVTPLTIITTELNNDTVCSGASVTFTVSATGSDLTYTWQKNWVTLSGHTSDTLDIPSATLADSGLYSVIVSGTCGTDTSSATLKVNAPPGNIILNVNGKTVNGTPDSIALCAGEPLIIYITNNNLNITDTIQWQKNDTTIPGQTTYILDISAVGGTNAGEYRSIVTSPCGADTTTFIYVNINKNTAVDTLTVNDSTITSKLRGIAICDGSSATFSVKATGSDLTYQWQHYGVNLSGDTSSTYTIPTTILSDSGRYDVIVTGTCGSDTSYAYLRINTKPTIVSQPSSQSMCGVNGQCGGFSLCAQATGVNLHYQWYFDGKRIVGATDSCYSVSPATFADTGRYRVLVYNECGSDTSNVAIFRLYDAPSITLQPTSVHICAVNGNGGDVSFCVQATGVNLHYQWYFDGRRIDGATDSCYFLTPATLGDTGRYRVIVTNECGSDTSTLARLRINTPPVITCQPKSESLCSMNGKCGGNGGVTFCVTATGNNLTYQWQYDGRNIYGANSSCYTINPVTISDSGRYDVIVSSSCSSDTSNTAILTIGSSPNITSQPVCISECSGNSATFCVTATGTDLTYQWYFNGRKIYGANLSCYTINTVTASNAGCYTVVVSNSCGSLTSYNATLTISTPPVITCQPKGESLCSTNGKCGGNDGVTFCVTTTGSNLSYQWQYNGRNIHGANSSCYTINPVSTSNAGNYDVIVSNSCGSDTSNIAVLNIGSSPVITSQPVCVSICSGSGATFCVTATGTDLSYQWQFNGRNINGANSSCYTIASAAACNAGCYDVIVSNSCGSLTSYTATLTLNTTPVITCQPQGQSVCSMNGKCGGNDGVTFCVTATGSNLSYQWQYNNKNIHGANSSCYTINPVSTSNAGCYDVIVSNSCSSVTSNTATLSIGSAPVITSQPVCTSVCSGSSATFCVTATGTNITYQWQFNGKNISGANSCCYTIASAASCNAGCYDVVVSNSCGSITSSTATLTINSAPSITCQPQSQSLCSTNGKCGGSEGVTFCVTATGSGLSYQWQYNGKNINGANSSCYTINPVTTSNAGCYDVIVSNSCRSTTSNTATLTIGNTPVITSQPSCLSLCLGNSATFCVTTTDNSNLTYQWQFNGKNISGATSSCYTIEEVASCNAGCYDVIVSNSCGSVTSQNATLTVNNCSTCVVPTDLISSDVTCNSVVLSWSYSSSASSFVVEYRASGCSIWTTKTVTSNSLSLSCLESGTTYQWSVNENCSCGSTSGYASVVQFCTSNNCCNGNNMSSPRGNGDNDSSSSNNSFITNVVVYPNPTFSLTTVHATFEKESDVTVMVTDITGRIIMTENEIAPVGDYIHQFDMSKQPQGTYFLIIRSGDQMVTSKIVKIE